MELDKMKYRKLVNDVELVNVLIKNIELSDVILHKDENIKNESIKCDVNMKYECEEFKKLSEVVEFYPKFNLRIECQGEGLVNLKFELRAIYKFNSIEDYEDDYILMFIERNVPINIWPYAREIISSITTRIGYPALVISPYKA